MKQIINTVLFSFIFLSFVPKAWAVVAGSDNSVSIQSHTFFPAADADNAMNGFGWFKNGFSLENAATSCLFDSAYPISSSMNMNGGTLILAQDMYFKDTLAIGSWGTFIGNNFIMDFTRAHITGSQLLTATFQDVTLISAGDYSVVNSFSFKGNCFFEGFGSAKLFWASPQAEFIIESSSSLTLRDIALKDISGIKIRCVDDSGVLVLNNVSIELDDNVQFSKGRILFKNQVDFSGSFSFVYDSSQSSTIDEDSSLNISQGLVFTIGRFTDNAAVEPLVFIDQSSVLHLDNSFLIINQHGAKFIKGSLRISNNVVADALGSSTATAFEIGDGIKADDFFFIFDSSSLYEIGGIHLLNDFQDDILLSNVGGAVVAAQNGSIIYINQNQAITNLISRANSNSQTIVSPGKTLTFNDLTVLVPTLGNFVITGTFVDAVTNALGGGQSIILNGALPSITLVSNQGNLISGNGQILAPIILQDANAQLLWRNGGQVSSNILLNGGTLDFLSDLNLGHGISINGPGKVLLNDQNLNIGYVDYDQGISWDGDIAFDGSIGVINFNAGLNLGTTWTISGDVVFVGNGNSLDLSNAQIVVEGKNSKLEFRNLHVTGVHGHNIQLLDDSQVWIVNNSNLLLDDDFTFSTGAIRWQNNVSLQGQTNLFIYESDQTFTVLSHSNLMLEGAVTFSYDTASPNLFTFESNTAVLILNGGELFAAKNGLNLTVGTMQVLAAGGTFASDMSITLGDCFNPANDFATIINNGFVVDRGTFNYKNVLGTSWLMQVASFWNFSDNTTLNVYQTINCGTSITTFGLNTTLGQANQAPCFATFNGSVSGSPTVALIPCCS